MASLTRSTVVANVQADDRVGQGLDLTKVNRWLNQFEQEIHYELTALAPRYNASTEDFTVSSSSDTGTIPSDYYGIDRGELGFFELNNSGDEISQYPLPMTFPGSKTKGWYIDESGQFKFTGFSNTSVTVRLYYMTEYTRKSSYNGTDTLIISDEFTELAEAYLAYRWAKDKRFRDRAIEFGAEYNEKLREFLERYTSRYGTRILNVPDTYPFINY